MKTLRHTIITLLLLLPLYAHSQEDADYRMEIGGGLGAGFYMGDFNNTAFSCQKAAFGATWRYLFDHYNSLKVSLTHTGIKGSTDDHDSFYPQNPNVGQANPTPRKYAFSSSITDLSCMYEINFLPYGYYQDFFGHKRLTPFLQLGLNMGYSEAAEALFVGFPIGCGLKYRVSKRVNLTFDWTMHFTLTDYLDGVADPLGIKSNGFKNKDHYSITMLTLTYSFAPRCVNCNKN